MFPRIRQTVLARADVLVELVTLGEYGLDERGVPMPLAAADDPPDAVGPAPATCMLTRRERAPRPTPGACATRVDLRRPRRGDLCPAEPEPCVMAPGGDAPARP